MFVVLFFFFKQKTAYEMRISDWSSDVCSSDRIEEGPRVYIERINIVGNFRTQDDVIRREFVLAEGDAFNRLLVEAARRRLRSLGFFKTVEIDTEIGRASCMERVCQYV